MSTEAEDRRIGQALVRSGLISREQLDSALGHQARSQGSVRLAAVLVELRLVSREQVLAATREDTWATVAPPSPMETPTLAAGALLPQHPLPTEVQAALRDDPHSRCGEYVLLKPPLGEGGFGAVYKAWDLNRREFVALKVLSRADTSARQRFTHEVKTMRALDHPGIVRIRDDGFSPRGAPYLVMDLLPGRPLDDVWKTGLEQRDAAVILAQAAQAVHHAHEQGVVHRDLKPANLVVGEGNKTWVLDLGLAKNEDLSRLTQSGSTMGTVSFMSPEQADGEARRVGPRSDVYSLGATLYFALTGRPPFDGDSAIAVINAVLNKPLPSPRALTPELDLDLEAICKKCLARDPDERYPSARALARDLDRYLEGEPVDARPVVGFVQLSKAQVQVGGAVAAAGLLLAGGFGLSGSSAKKAAPFTKTDVVVKSEVPRKTDSPRKTSPIAPRLPKPAAVLGKPRPTVPRFLILGERTGDSEHGLLLSPGPDRFVQRRFGGFGAPSYEAASVRVGDSLYVAISAHGSQQSQSALTLLRLRAGSQQQLSPSASIAGGLAARGVALRRVGRDLVATMCMSQSRSLAQFTHSLDAPFDQAPTRVDLGPNSELGFKPVGIAALRGVKDRDGTDRHDLYLISGLSGSGKSTFCVFSVRPGRLSAIWQRPRVSNSLRGTGGIVSLGGRRFVLLGADGSAAFSIILGPHGDLGARRKHYQVLTLPGRGRAGAFGRLGEHENVLAIASGKTIALFTAEDVGAQFRSLSPLEVRGASSLTAVAFSWGELWALDRRLESGHDTWVWRLRARGGTWERVPVKASGVGETLIGFPSHPFGRARASTLTVPGNVAGGLETDVALKKGELFSVSARGSWTNGIGQPLTGPDGFGLEWPNSKKALLLGTGIMALVGRIGAGPWFRIGARVTGRATRSGKLILAPNDGHHSDNSGSVRVTVSRYGMR